MKRMNLQTNPLVRYSLSGQGAQLTESTINQQPLLGDLCLKGEISIWYAPPNTGKTLIGLATVTAAVVDKRIPADKVFYVNADDSASGLAAKTMVFDDFGIHCLAPGRNGFKAAHLIPAMEQMAQDGTADGTLIIIDTIKKFTDPMSKADCRNFGNVARQFCLAGGTMLGFSHTNKSRGNDNALIYGGTTDLLEDSDSVYLVDRLPRTAKETDQFVRFECIKNRGPNAALVHYRYSIEPDLSYAQRLASVELSDPEYGDLAPEDNCTEDGIAARIQGAIMAGRTKKMDLVAIASKAARASKRKVLDVLERNTGPDPDKHLWNYTSGHEHNTYRYFLHESPVAPEADTVTPEAEQQVPPPEPEEEQGAA